MAQYLKYKFEYRIYALAGVNIEFNYITVLNSEFTPADAYIRYSNLYFKYWRQSWGQNLYHYFLELIFIITGVTQQPTVLVLEEISLFLGVW